MTAIDEASIDEAGIGEATIGEAGIDALPTPSLVVDLDRFDANVDAIVALARSRGIEFAPHAKTHRIPSLGVRQLERGAARLTVAKLGEAEAFAAAGVAAVFVAYPVVGAHVPERALALHRRVDLRLGVDSVAGAAELGAAFAAEGERARVLLAIDTGLGREGVAPASAPGMAAAIAGLPGIDLVGVFTHEGHAYGAVDAADLVARSRDAALAMVEAAAGIRALGIACPVVSLGASASVAAVAEVPGVTELRPGIACFGDAGLIALGVHAHDRLAATVVATVVSAPEPGRACIDAGSKALGADLVLAAAHRDEFDGFGVLELHDRALGTGWRIARLSEEHGWLRWDAALGDAPQLPVGTRVRVVPAHVCMAFAGLRRAVVTRDAAIVGVWDGLGPGAST